MGQVLRTLVEYPGHKINEESSSDQNSLLDLSNWPPELSLRVLSNLNATDLFLASGVWKDLALDEVLWHSLCRSNWGYASIYKKLPLQLSTDSSGHSINSYKRLYLLLDEATVTFNADAFLGMNYLFAHSLLEDSPSEIAKFFYYSRRLRRSQIRLYIQSNASILDHLVRLENFANIPLCAALRRYFGQVIGSSVSEVSNSDLDSNLHILIDKFANRFCECNPGLGLNQNSVYILCYSLLLLSTDLSSPHIKNKMSKREFIRNVRHALDKMDDDLYGQLYDDVYLRGHVAFIAGTTIWSYGTLIDTGHYVRQMVHFTRLHSSKLSTKKRKLNLNYC